MPKNKYEKFVNKKWKERRDIFEDKKVFIARTKKVWKKLSGTEKHVFMNAAPPPPKKNHIHGIKRVRIWSYSGPHFSRIFPHSD